MYNIITNSNILNCYIVLNNYLKSLKYYNEFVKKYNIKNEKELYLLYNALDIEIKYNYYNECISPILENIVIANNILLDKNYDNNKIIHIEIINHMNNIIIQIHNNKNQL